MRSRLVLASLVVVVGIAVYAGTVLATPPSAVTPTTYGIGKLSSFDTSGRIGAWKAKMDIRGASDIYVLSNTIAPGGSFGWHSHPGPSFVIVKSGMATFYLGADPMCRPHRVQAGSTFVDKGRAVHIVRNEGTVDLVTVVVSFLPRGATRRIDEADPGNCSF
jgi:quercetin dioxygenase-like cupin family protein